VTFIHCLNDALKPRELHTEWSICGISPWCCQHQSCPIPSCFKLDYRSPLFTHPTDAPLTVACRRNALSDVNQLVSWSWNGLRACFIARGRGRRLQSSRFSNCYPPRFSSWRCQRPQSLWAVLRERVSCRDTHSLRCGRKRSDIIANITASEVQHGRRDTVYNGHVSLW